MDKRTILLVEDETDVMLANKEYLEGKGMLALEADSIGEAREILQHTPVNLILLDVNLPDGSGLAFVQEIR